MHETRGYKSRERKVVFAFGVLFVGVLLAVAFFFPRPSAFQYVVFRIVLALASAGVAAFIPGFISVVVSRWVRAGGAMAVFVIVYFFSPANLVTKPNNDTLSPVVQQIRTVQQTTESGSNTAGVQGNVTNANQSTQQDDNVQPKKQKTK
jgi:ABC-type transport system involved in multi-copper enzyme maturation permease subunit